MERLRDRAVRVRETNELPKRRKSQHNKTQQKVRSRLNAGWCGNVM
jgi:hypothetical protein